MLRFVARPAARVLARTYSADAGAAAGKAPPARVVSSVPAGTRLKGCNVRKNGEDPVALEDSEYPAWLWEVLDPAAQEAKLAADPIRAARRARRADNRKTIKEQNFLSKLN